MSEAATPSDARPREVASQVAWLARSILGEDVVVYWFGSWPEGRAVERSDLDIGILARGPVPLEDFSRLRGAVERLPTAYQVDLVDLATVDAALRDRARERGQRL